MSVLDQLAIVRSTREARRREIRSGEALATFAVIGAILLAPLVMSPAALNDLGQALAMGLFAIGFNIVFKYSGLLSFGHAAFFGFAAYLEALLLRGYPSTPVPLGCWLRRRPREPWGLASDTFACAGQAPISR